MDIGRLNTLGLVEDCLDYTGIIKKVYEVSCSVMSLKSFGIPSALWIIFGDILTHSKHLRIQILKSTPITSRLYEVFYEDSGSVMFVIPFGITMNYVNQSWGCFRSPFLRDILETLWTVCMPWPVVGEVWGRRYNKILRSFWWRFMLSDVPETIWNHFWRCSRSSKVPWNTDLQVYWRNIAILQSFLWRFKFTNVPETLWHHC